jgi:hypothetical protein
VIPRGKNLRQNHGDYFSARQAAEALGVSRAAVHALRKRGTLIGYRLRRPKTPNKSGRGLWWFFLKEDIWARKKDPQDAERSCLVKQALRNPTTQT